MKKLLTLIFVAEAFLCSAQQTYYDITPGNGYGLRFWQSDLYKIHMGNSSEYQYGPVTDYSIKMNMSNTSGRGWTWGVAGSTPVAAISTSGDMQIGGNFGVLRSGTFLDPWGKWTRIGDSYSTSYPLYLGTNKSGLTAVWDSDGAFFGLSDEGSNRKDAIIAWGDDPDDNLRFLFNNGELARLTASGNLGIGTTSPQNKLEVHGKTAIGQYSNGTAVIDAFNSYAYFGCNSATNGLAVGPNGNVGIGTVAPRGKFDVDGAGDIYLSGDLNAGLAQSLFIPGHIYISPYNGTNISYLQARRYDNSGTTSLRFRTYTNGTLTESMHIEGNGNVGVGTTTPAYKLDVNGPINAASLNINGQPVTSTQWTTAGASISYTGKVGIGTPLTSNPNNYSLAVNGTIGAKDVRVEKSSTTWPDYVFDKGYDLPSLKELENYIQEHKHLEDVPSAKTVEEKGYSLNEMDVILLKKVEELSLYIIQQQKEIQQQQNEIDQQRKKDVQQGEMNMLLLKKIEEFTLYVVELKRKNEIQQNEIERK